MFTDVENSAEIIGMISSEDGKMPEQVKFFKSVVIDPSEKVILILIDWKLVDENIKNDDLITLRICAIVFSQLSCVIWK